MQTQSSLEVERMCELARVSRASYYRWLQPPEEDRAEEMELRNAIQQGSLEHRFYGYRRIAAVLRQQGWIVNTKRVRRLMNEDGLLAIRRRKFVVTTDSGHGMRIYPNLAGSLELADRDQLWVSDLTYIRLGEQFCFLAVVLDAYSRRVVGWAVGESLTSQLALTALEVAIQGRKPKPGLVHHSDRGTQYASHLYTGKLESIGALASMSRPGRPWENGKCESFMRTIKKEEVDARSYRNREELERNIEEFIERDYNQVRLHSALGYQSPQDFERVSGAAAAANGPGWRPAAMSFTRHEEIYPDAS
jgi:transposase InsO family protein